MEKYLESPGHFGIPMIFLALIPIGIITIPYGEYLWGVLAVVGGIWCFMETGQNGRKRYKAWWKPIQDQGKAQMVLDDFRDARDYMGGKLRLGQNRGFGKGADIPCTYGEINRVYQHIHKTTFIEDERMLVAQIIYRQAIIL